MLGIVAYSYGQERRIVVCEQARVRVVEGISINVVRETIRLREVSRHICGECATTQSVCEQL